MPPPKKSTTSTKKSVKAPAKKTDQGIESSKAAPQQQERDAARSQDVVAPNAVQPTTNTTNMSAEQHNSPAMSEEAVRQRAYELYEQRGRNAGRHHEDWFRAEQEIRERYRHTP